MRSGASPQTNNPGPGRTNYTNKSMSTIPHSARITGPISYTTSEGKKRKIPLGPCMVEQSGPGAVDIVWGSKGESSAAFSVSEVKSAAEIGHLLLLD